jgi:hypothetical protein
MSERQIPYYFSSVRGNISSITCDYGNPCPPDWALVRDDAFRRTLRRCIFVLCVLLNRFSLPSLEAANRIDVVLLSGVYSFGNIDPSTPMGKLIDSISFYGAKDCWPAPENVYDCAATTPVVNALSTISSPRFVFNISNVIFRANESNLEHPVTLLNVSGSVSWINIYNITIDPGASRSNSFILSWYQGGLPGMSSLRCAAFHAARNG